MVTWRSTVPAVSSVGCRAPGVFGRHEPGTNLCSKGAYRFVCAVEQSRHHGTVNLAQTHCGAMAVSCGRLDRMYTEDDEVIRCPSGLTHHPGEPAACTAAGGQTKPQLPLSTSASASIIPKHTRGPDLAPRNDIKVNTGCPCGCCK
jgi:hypothetical protein